MDKCLPPLRVDLQQPRIVLAAVKRADKIWTGSRHNFIISTVYLETGVRVTQSEQGFVDSDGNFLNRAEAAEVAYRAGQIKVQKPELCSEDVW